MLFSYDYSLFWKNVKDCNKLFRRVYLDVVV